MEYTPIYNELGEQTGWQYADPNGVIQYADMELNPIGSAYVGGTPIATLPQSLPEGYQIVFDPSTDEPVRDVEGNYYIAPYQEGADQFGYQPDTAANPMMNPMYPAFAPVAPGTPAPAPAAPSGTYPADSGHTGYTRSYTPSRSSGGYGYQGSASSPGQQSGYSPSSPYPQYADGRVHPYWSGVPLTPGGRWNTDGEGGGGAGRGTYVPDLPYSPASSAPSGYGSSGGGSGGSSGRALYDAWRSKLEAKLYPGSGAGYSGAGQYGSSQKQPNYAPPENQMQGRWAQRVHPDQAASVSYRPTSLIPRVAPSLNSTSPLYQDVAAMPASQLSLIQSSRQRTDPGKSGFLTYGQNGRPRTVGDRPSTVYSDQINALGSFYNDTINKEQFPTFDSLTKNLTQTRPNSVLGLQMKDQPAAYQASTYSSMLGAALGETLDPRSAGTYAEAGSALLDQYTNKFMKRNPRNTPMPTKWVGRRLF